MAASTSGMQNFENPLPTEGRPHTAQSQSIRDANIAMNVGRLWANSRAPGNGRYGGKATDARRAHDVATGRKGATFGKGRARTSPSTKNTADLSRLLPFAAFLWTS